MDIHHSSFPSPSPHSTRCALSGQAYPLPQGERERKSMKILPSPFSRKDKSRAFWAGTYLAAHCRRVGRGMGPSRRLGRAARGQGRRGTCSRSRSPADARGGGCHQPVGAGPWVRAVQPRAGPATGTVLIQLSFKASFGGPLFSLVHWALLQAVASRRHAGRPAATRAPGEAGFSATIKNMRKGAEVKSRGDCGRGRGRGAGSKCLSLRCL